MYRSRLRLWLPFAGWLMGAFLFGLVDHIRQTSSFLPAYLVVAGILAVLITRKHGPRNYRFELLAPGIVRSPLGFEVQASTTGVRYREGDRVITWQSSPVSSGVSGVNLSEQALSGWDPPFANEPIDLKKKQEVGKAVRSALMYLQLVEAGKIRPRTVHNSRG